MIVRRRGGKNYSSNSRVVFVLSRACVFEFIIKYMEQQLCMADGNTL